MKGTKKEKTPEKCVKFASPSYHLARSVEGNPVKGVCSLLLQAFLIGMEYGEGPDHG